MNMTTTTILKRNISMTKKTTTKAPAKPRKLYPDLSYQVGNMNGCCGIGVVSNFTDSHGEWDYSDWNSRYKPAKKKYVTKREQAQACYNAFIDETAKGGRYGDTFYSQLLVSLVSSYGKNNDVAVGSHQNQDLQDILLENGWVIYSVFINPNHGNEVTLFGKYFPERDKVPSDDEGDDLDDNF
jgi:hypothetical protein